VSDLRIYFSVVLRFSFDFETLNPLSINFDSPKINLILSVVVVGSVLFLFWSGGSDFGGVGRE
jgi:hypothetical protein